MANPYGIKKRTGGRCAAGSTDTIIQLDSELALGDGTNTLSVALPDGTIETKSISDGVGTYTAVTLSSALSAAPNQFAQWALNVSLYRVISVKKGEGIEYEISALQYTPEKYALIEAADITVATDPTSVDLTAPAGLALTYGTQVEKDKLVQFISASWTAVTVATYVADAALEYGPWLPMRIDGATATLEGVTPGTWNIRVKAIYADTESVYATDSIVVAESSEVAGDVAVLATASGATLGGTGQTSWTLGDLLYSSATDTLAKLAGNTTATKMFLRQTGTGTVSAAPAWDTVTKSDVGLGDVENTALSTWAGTTNITTLGTVTTGTWSATAIGPTVGGTGQTTYALGDILYSSAANTLSKLAGNTSATLAVLTQTGNGSVSAAPAWTTTTGTGSIVRALAPTFGAGVTSFTDTTASTSTTSGSVKLAGGLGVVGAIYSGTLVSTSVATTLTSGYYYATLSNLTVANTGASTGDFRAGQFASVTTGSTASITGVNGITGAVNHTGTGLLATAQAGGFSINVSGGNATNAYATQGTFQVSGTTALTVTNAVGVRGTVVVGNANATVTAVSCFAGAWSLTGATAVPTISGMSIAALSVASLTSTTTVSGITLGAINGASTTPATNAYALLTGNVTGATNNWQLNLGTGISKFNDTTSGTSTTAAAVVAKSLGLTENLWVGGTANVAGVATLANTTDASAIGTAGTVVVGGLSVARQTIHGDHVTFADAKNIIFNTTTGTKIGTATNQKFAFFDATPTVQPAAVTTALATRTAGATYTATEQTMIQEAHDMARTLAVAIRSLGLAA